MKNQISPYVEVKAVTWCKDSHGLFDYESKNVTFTKSKVDSSSRVYKDGAEINIRTVTKFRTIPEETAFRDPNYLFSITADKEKNDNFFIQFDKSQLNSENENRKLFLVVKSLKDESGAQTVSMTFLSFPNTIPQGYNLELGDVIRLGRIEYRVIEYQDHELKVSSLLSGSTSVENCPFSITLKNCNEGTEETEEDSSVKKQCRICLMDEDDVPEDLVNPCNCKGTSQHVHIQCLQDWITSKLKKKVNPETTCFYWKKLNCEVCKVSLPDLVEIDGSKKELIPIYRPQGPYILLERVFYDRSKENADNAKSLILLNINDPNQQIKLGRGHECDLRENDISVSRMHAFIKYQDGKFNIADNSSKFGTLILLRKNFRIEKDRKVALQFGRTITTFALKHSPSINIPTLKSPTFLEKLNKWHSPKHLNTQLKPTVIGYNRPKNVIISSRFRAETQPHNLNLNGSFLD